MGESRLIIADTGPLISLAHLDQVGLLRALYESVLVPPEVVDELARNRREVARGVLSQHPWIEVRSPASPLAPELAAKLDRGESFALALALELSAPVLIDERDGRRMAQRALGLEVRGTLGTLSKARRAGLVGPLAPLLSRLLEEGDRFSSELIEDTLRSVGERD